jgi:prevent-host-death family protein
MSNRALAPRQGRTSGNDPREAGSKAVNPSCGGIQVKTKSLREVRNNFSRVIDELGETGAVLITRNGKASAVLLPVGDDTDVESLLLASNRKFWSLFDRAAESKRWTPLDQI